MSMSKLSEGAEACIYSARVMGRRAVVKRRIRKYYRIDGIDSSMRAQRTKSEARIMGLVSSLGINSPVLLFVDTYDIAMSRVDGTNLNILMEKGGKLDSIFQTLGRYAASLHNNNITHGDLTPANVIVGNGGVCIIDFGLAAMTNSIEDKALDILLMKRAIDRQSFSKFVESYKRNCNEGASVLNRLAKIEKRGRYNTRTIMTN